MSEPGTTPPGPAGPPDRAGAADQADQAFARVEQYLGTMFARARASAAVAARQIHPELGTGAYPILLRIWETGGARITDLATHFAVGKPTMSRQVTSLERLGLVQRDVDPADGRGALVSLSGPGRERFALARQRRRDWLERVMSDFSADEIAEFGRLLERFVRSA